MGLTAIEKKPHAVCIPFPAQGHINAMLQLAKLLHSSGLHVTFLHTQSNYDRVAGSLSGLPGFRFEAVPADVQLADPALHRPLWAPTRALLTRLSVPGSGVPPPTCVVSEVFMSFTVDCAAELGIPCVLLCPVSACSFMAFLHYEELRKRGVVPPRSDTDLNTIIDWIPGMSNIRAKDLPNYARVPDPNEVLWHFSKNEAQAARRAAAIVMHTLDELERPVLDALSSFLPPVYPIGPLNLLAAQIADRELKSIGSSLWKADSSCTAWLDGRAPGSVIYINFGSAATLTSRELVEFAWGIANSGHDFLWVIRPNVVAGAAAVDVLEEFLAETSGRGLVTSWCVQEEVLGHASVGGFLTHCGWNSTMEAMGAGVQVICWPLFADQLTNCRYLCNEWGVGLEVGTDVKRAEVSEKIRELLGSEKGKELRKNAAKWKESASRATEIGGNSWLNLERIIKEFMSV